MSTNNTNPDGRDSLCPQCGSAPPMPGFFECGCGLTVAFGCLHCVEIDERTLYCPNCSEQENNEKPTNIRYRGSLVTLTDRFDVNCAVRVDLDQHDKRLEPGVYYFHIFNRKEKMAEGMVEGMTRTPNGHAVEVVDLGYHTPRFTLTAVGEIDNENRPIGGAVLVAGVEGGTRGAAHRRQMTEIADCVVEAVPSIRKALGKPILLGEQARRDILRDFPGHERRRILTVFD